ncbi:hypothetical protein [Clostridium sp. CTA-1]
MKTNKIKSLILGVMAVTIMSSTPVFAATNTVKNTSASLAASQEELPSLTVDRSKSAIPVSGISVISGYAKNSDGTPLINAAIWIKIEAQTGPSTMGTIVYDQVHTDSNGYYSVKVYGRDLDYFGYHQIDVYIDNGTNKDYTEIGHGKYEIEHNTWADVKASTGIFLSSHM